MSKYMCFCGKSFNRKKEADKHISLWAASGAESSYQNYQAVHVIAKKNWKARLIDIADYYPWQRFFRVTGGYILLQLLVHHFHIELTMWEGALAGLAIGLIL